MVGDGGEGGIRTREGCYTLPAFQASALDQLCDLSVRRCLIFEGSQRYNFVCVPKMVFQFFSIQLCQICRTSKNGVRSQFIEVQLLGNQRCVAASSNHFDAFLAVVRFQK